MRHMDKSTKFKITVRVAALTLAVGLGAVGAVAASGALSPDEESQAVIDDVAGQLGVEPSALAKAIKEVLKNRVDAAVESGRLTEAQGEQLKGRIDAGRTPFLFGGFGHRGLGFGGFGHRGLGFGQWDSGFGHRGRSFGHFRILEPAAAYLGLSEAVLRERLADGDTLAAVARDEGKSVEGLVRALVDDAEAKIDAAVADGRLTEERATELKDALQARVPELVNGELRGRGFRFHRGFRHGFGFDGGPPGFRGPHA